MITEKTQETRGEDLRSCPEAIVINAVQLILAEKRTSLAGLRTGIAVCAIPLSLAGALIATSKYYDVLDVMHLFIPFVVLNLLLVVLGVYLIVRAITKLRREDRMIRAIKLKHSTLSELID